MDARRCIEEADLCDFNNALIRGFGIIAGLESRGSNGSKCYQVFSFATEMLMW